jgi:hypothetical protein
MLSKLVSHVRQNVVAYLALFIALGGTAVAARPLITGDQIAPDTITDANIATANKDGTPSTPSLRTLGNGTQQAAAGDDPRLSDARTPTGTSGGDLAGTYPNPTLADGAVRTAKFSSTIPVARVAGNFINVDNNSPTALPWQSTDVLSYDSASLFSGSRPSRLTAPVTGVYRLSAIVLWPSSPNGARDVLFLRNGQQSVGAAPALNSSSGQYQQASTEAKLAAGDYIEVIVNQSSGAALNGVVGLSWTMSWVAPG